ncbi:MAG: 2,3-dihydroxyphenylpropionate 1,2-dioxygenase [Candidatus Rokubacteria bacterium]|nr:2,3-dihydroxyphenylpropionate 1,2-dioxygenase [Candidatus Rokubacteria bacterium]
MASLVAAVAASHAPLITAAPETADPVQRDRVYAAMAALQRELDAARPDALVVCSNEHFTNFFLDNFPPFCIGIGERHVGPAEEWLGIPRRPVAGHRALGLWLLERAFAGDFDPAFSEELRLDHGIMTVVHFLDPELRLPVVPVIQNCAVRPMPSLRRCYRFGAFLRDAIEAWPAPARVALVGAGGLSHWVGMPGMGRLNVDFDRWFLECLAGGRPEAVLDLTDADLERAGNGAHEIRSWLTVAGAMPGASARVLAYEPIPQWVTGMGVITYGREPAPA